MKLVVLIETGAAAYREATFAIAPGHWLVPIELAPITNGLLGSVELTGSQAQQDRALALYLRELQRASRERPAVAFRIEIEPDGGVLTLRAGSFGDDAAEVEELLRWTVDDLASTIEGGHTSLYTSVRLPDDAHAHFLDLVERQLPAGWPRPVTDASPAAIALGFELTGDPAHTAQLISVLRYAWLVEGSQAECLVEVEGPAPIVRRIHALADWGAFERELRAKQVTPAAPSAAPEPGAAPRDDDGAEDAAGHSAPTAPRGARGDEVARLPPLHALGDRVLTWLDDRDQLFAVGSDGVVCRIRERIEAGSDGVTMAASAHVLLRRDDGTWAIRAPRGQHARAVPGEPGAHRRVHAETALGILLTDQRGADTRFLLARHDGVQRGPVFRDVRGLVVARDAPFVYFVADLELGTALLTMDLRTWGYDYLLPWPASARVLDAAACGATLLSTTDGAADDVHAALHVANLHLGPIERTLYLPCRAPSIAHVDDAVALVVGASFAEAGSHPPRHDLFEVDLGTHAVTLLTARAQSARWGRLAVAHAGAQTLLAYEHAGLFALGAHGTALEALVPLADGDRIRTDPHGALAVCAGPPFVALTDAGHAVVCGEDVASVALPMRGHAPRLVAPGAV